jgi:hypothetical protein
MIIIEEGALAYFMLDLRDAEKKFVKYCLSDGGYLKNIVTEN